MSCWIIKLLFTFVSCECMQPASEHQLSGGHPQSQKDSSFPAVGLSQEEAGLPEFFKGDPCSSSKLVRPHLFTGFSQAPDMLLDPWAKHVTLDQNAQYTSFRWLVQWWECGSVEPEKERTLGIPWELSKRARHWLASGESPVQEAVAFSWSKFRIGC